MKKLILSFMLFTSLVSCKAQNISNFPSATTITPSTDLFGIYQPANTGWGLGGLNHSYKWTIGNASTYFQSVITPIPSAQVAYGGTSNQLTSDNGFTRSLVQTEMYHIAGGGITGHFQFRYNSFLFEQFNSGTHNNKIFADANGMSFEFQNSDDNADERIKLTGAGVLIKSRGVEWTWPHADGTIGQALSTNGTGDIGFVDVLSSVAVDGVTITGDGTPGNPLVAGAPGGVPTQIPYTDVSSGLLTGDGDFTRDNSNNNFTVIKSTDGTDIGYTTVNKNQVITLVAISATNSISECNVSPTQSTLHCNGDGGTDESFVFANSNNATLKYILSGGTLKNEVLADNAGLKLTSNNGATNVTLTWPTTDGTAGQSIHTNGSGTLSFQSTPIITSGVVAPVSTPAKIGDMFIDTVLKKIYVATGTSSSADWTIVN